ncbi:MAG: hypothetical protein AAF211_12165, partial [Myxococcota bacterium]
GSNPNLTNLSPLQGLTRTTVGGISLVSMPIVTLADLSSLTEVSGDVSISFCDEMVDPGGPPLLTTIGGALRISFNERLASVAGFAPLDTIGTDLSIRGNDVLTDLAGLEGVDVGVDVSIRENPVLGDANAQAFVDTLTVGGTVSISDNG